MRLSGEEMTQRFGVVWTASGAVGWFNEGYWFHRIVPGFSFEHATPVAKTTTLYATPGNMELRADFTPRRLFPDCIWVDPLRAIGLNAVGLSGPGLHHLLNTGMWQVISTPHMLSLMPTANEAGDQEREIHGFVRQLGGWLSMFRTQPGIQLNISCPNVKADLSALIAKAEKFLDILAGLQLPVVVKLNLLVSPEAAASIAAHPACSAILMGNTVPFGELPDLIDWKRLFPNGSPLAKRKYQPGGLSGAPLLPLVTEWVAAFRELNHETHVNAGGGILHSRDLRQLKEYGADSVSLGSVAMLRPWRVQNIIRTARETFPAR